MFGCDGDDEDGGSEANAGNAGMSGTNQGGSSTGGASGTTSGGGGAGGSSGSSAGSDARGGSGGDAGSGGSAGDAGGPPVGCMPNASECPHELPAGMSACEESMAQAGLFCSNDACNMACVCSSMPSNPTTPFAWMCFPIGG